MLHEEIPLLLHNVDWLELFGSLFSSLERFNKMSPCIEREDDDDMSWPGVTGKNLLLFEVALDFNFSCRLNLFSL